MSDDTIPGDKNTGTASFPISGAVVGGEMKHENEPMTEEQAVYLRQLCKDHDEPFDANLTREQANARIKALEKA